MPKIVMRKYAHVSQATLLAGCPDVAGNCTEKLEPVPGSLLKVIFPPWASRIFCAVDSPRPVPEGLVV